MSRKINRLHFGSLIFSMLMFGGALLCGSSTTAFAQDQRLEGGFFGIGNATGMRILIAETDTAEPYGIFFDSNGAEANFEGYWHSGGLEALLLFEKRNIFMRLTSKPAGISMLALPLDSEGAPIEAQAVTLAFVRDGTKLPELPELYRPAPTREGMVMTPDVFLASYPFWPVDGLGRAYDALEGKYRTMIRFKPLVQADLLWRICRLPAGQVASLSEALRGQGVDCGEIIAQLDRLELSSRYGAFQQAVAEERDSLMEAVQCARGFELDEARCAKASADMSQAAISMETVASKLAAWK